MQLHSIPYEGIVIEYQLSYKDVKYINLRITAQGNVVVSAPKHAAFSVIDDFVRSRADWIFQHLAEIEQRKQSLPSRQLYDGKTLYLLGKAYTLHLSEGPKHITTYGDTLHMTTLQKTQEGMRKEYLTWLQHKAKRIFLQVLEDVHPFVAPYGIPYPILKIRNMRSIWGSCNIQQKVIRLNLQLIKTDLFCIREVIYHELAHFRYPNHNQAFYALLAEWMPDWKDAKTRMETMYRDGI